MLAAPRLMTHDMNGEDSLHVPTHRYRQWTVTHLHDGTRLVSAARHLLPWRTMGLLLSSRGEGKG